MESTHQLLSRASCYYDRYGRRRCGNFYSWGRWVLAGVIIFVVLFFALICCCLARRRRKRGTKPYYGTGWMAPAGGKFGIGGHNNAYGNNNQMHGYGQGGYNQGGYNQGGYNGPPAYGQQTQPQYDGYYGQQQYGNVQAPQATYQQQGVYSPPPGPPPGK